MFSLLLLTGLEIALLNDYTFTIKYLGTKNMAVLHIQNIPVNNINSSVKPPFHRRELPAPPPRDLSHLRPGHPKLLRSLERLVRADASAEAAEAPQAPRAPRLTVLCRTAAQAEAVLQLPAGVERALGLRNKGLG